MMMNTNEISNEVKDKAKMLYSKACSLETEGKSMEAVEFYRLAFKLYPNIENEEGLEEEGDSRYRNQKEAELRNKAGLDDSVTTEDLLNRFTLVERKTTPASYRTFDARKLSTSDTEEKSNAKKYLESEGYVVFDNCLNSDEIKESLEYFKNFLDAAITDQLAASPAESVINKPKALVGSRISNPGNGIVWKYGAGSSKFNWFNRSRKTVKDAFKSVVFSDDDTSDAEDESENNNDEANKKENKNKINNNNKKLITSFDGLNFIVNEEAHDEGGGVDASWLHTDAIGHLTGDRYFQGLVNILDNTADTEPSFVVFPKSHRKVFPVILPGEGTKPENGSDIHYLNNLDLLRMADPANEIHERPFRVPLKPGSLVIWKSSTLHCSIGCTERKEELKNPSQVFRRIASYICMVKDPMVEKVQADRLEKFSSGVSSGHQPDYLQTASGPPTDVMKKLGVVITDEKDLFEEARELL